MYENSLRLSYFHDNGKTRHAIERFDERQWEYNVTHVSGMDPLGIGSASRTRTCDQKINSLLLYQLSYRGTQDGREL